MPSFMRCMSAICIVYAALAAVPKSGIASGATLVAAAGSCTGIYNTCVARCRKDVPDDKACPSDHCMPKLATCKTSGCWQEGARYGGKQTCDLKRG